MAETPFARSGRGLSGARSILLAAALAALAACDNSGGSAPGAVSQGEADALDDAAEMLDERRLPEGVLPPIEPSEIAAPEDGATDSAEMTGDTEE